MDLHSRGVQPQLGLGVVSLYQDMFWGMHHMLFDKQQEWSGSSTVGDFFKGYAVDLGMDNETFNTCYDGSEHTSEINADFSAGQSYGVQGTPSNFLIIPKSKISEVEIRAVMDSLNSEYGEGIVLFENSNEYTVFIPGAYPFEAFDTVFKAVNY